METVDKLCQITNVTQNIPVNLKVYNVLFNAIVSGKLRPGERLLEGEIANKLGVSRTPIREALKSLERENLVRIAPYRGAIVTTLSYEEAEELLEVCLCFEGFICSAAAKNASKKDIDLLNSIIKKHQDSFVESDLGKMQKLDYLFHVTVSEIAGNKLAKDIYASIRAKMNIISIMTLSLVNRAQLTICEHTGILNALVEKNEILAKKRGQEHIENIASITLDRLKKGFY